MDIEKEKRIFGEMCEKVLNDRIVARIKAFKESGGSLEVSDRHKLRMNRFFREVVRSTYLPYPDMEDFRQGENKFY